MYYRCESDFLKSINLKFISAESIYDFAGIFLGINKSCNHFTIMHWLHLLTNYNEASINFNVVFYTSLQYLGNNYFVHYTVKPGCNDHL